MKEIVIIGVGGLGREVAAYIDDINNLRSQYKVLGFVDDDTSKLGLQYNGLKVLGNTDIIKDLNKNNDIYCFCAIANPIVKQKIADKLKEYKAKTINIIHPSSYISPSVKLGTNVLISPMCVITTNIYIGDYVHINPQCGIGHDTIIEAYSTLYWNVNTGGFTHISKLCELGSKSFIKQNINIGYKAVIGAGSVVVKDVNSETVVKGVPAK